MECGTVTVTRSESSEQGPILCGETWLQNTEKVYKIKDYELKQLQRLQIREEMFVLESTKCLY